MIIKWLEDAVYDLQAVRQYIALDKPAAANRIAKKIISATSLLSEQSQVELNQIAYLDLTPLAFAPAYTHTNSYSEHKIESLGSDAKKTRSIASSYSLGSGDPSFQLLHYSSSSCVSTLTGHSDWVLALAVLPNDSLASGSDDHTIKLWDIASGLCLSTLKGHAFPIWALAVLPNGFLASAYFDKTIKLWDPKAKTFSLITQQVQTILNALENNTSVTALDLSVSH